MARRQRAQRPRLVLDPAADVEEVAGGQLEPRGQALAHLGGGAPQVAAGDARLDGDPPAPRLALDGGRAEGPLDPGELAEGDAGAVPAVDQQRAERREVAAPVVREPHDEVEAALPHPDLRDLLAGEADRAGRRPRPPGRGPPAPRPRGRR